MVIRYGTWLRTPLVRSLRRSLTVLTLTAGLVLLAACGDGEPTNGIAGPTSAASAGAGTGEGATAAPATTVRVAITDFAFEPAVVKVAPGTKVVFENRDDTDHTATAADGSFNSGTIERGKEMEVVVNAAGPHDYRCSFHPFMKAVIEVVQA
jgi:plastocyanin